MINACSYISHVDCVTPAPGQEERPGPGGKGEQQNIGPGENVHANVFRILKHNF